MAKPKPVPASQTPKATEYVDRVVYVGLTPALGNAFFAVFVKLTEEEIKDPSLVKEDVPSQRKLLYDPTMAKRLSMCRPGAIFRVKLQESNVIYERKAQPVGFVSDEVRMKWAAVDSAVRRSMEALKSLEDEAKRNVVQEMCEPLRAAWRRCPTGMAKQQLLAEIVFHITRQG